MLGFVSIPASLPTGYPNKLKQCNPRKVLSGPGRSANVLASSSPDSARISRRSAMAALLRTSAAITAVGCVSPLPVLADHTLQSAKRALDRYYPRIAAGSETLRSIGAMLARGEVSAASAAANEREFDVKFRRALDIYASSFSDNYVGQKTKDLKVCSNRLFDELGALKTAESIDDEIMQHYTVAVEAFTKYVRIARLPIELLDGFKA